MGSTGDVVRGKGRLELVFCCSTKDKPEGLNLERRRDWRGSSVNLCFLTLFGWCVPSECLLVLGTGMSWEKEGCGRRYLCSIQGGVREQRQTAVGFLLQGQG